MSANRKFPMSPEEYLAFERASDMKHEYVDGEVYAMAGAQPNHNLISFNIGIEIGRQIGDRPCSGYSSDQRVKVSHARYFYPDITVVCGEPVYEPTGLDTLINPTLIVEVLSQSTADYDRSTKAIYYQRMELVHEYLFVSQDKTLIERYTRYRNGEWRYLSVIDIDSTVELASIGCALSSSAAYRRVVFPDTPVT